MITKTVIKWAATLIGLILIIFCTPLRYFNPAREGSGNGSKDINDSRERGVYLLRYKLKENPIVLKNGLTLHVSEAWAERPWTYGVFTNQTQVWYKPPLYRVCILFANDEENIAREFASTGRLQLGTYPYILYCNNTAKFILESDLYLPPDRHFSFPVVQRGLDKSQLNALDTIGHVQLYADDW